MKHHILSTLALAALACNVHATTNNPIQERPDGVIVLNIDIQNDFCETPDAEEVNLKEEAIKIVTKPGALAVNGANEQYKKAVTNFITKARAHNLRIGHTQDWHTADNISFASNPLWKSQDKKVFELVTTPNGQAQTLWPDHCVQGTHGAEFIREIYQKGDLLQQKGQDPKIDSYSGFDDNAGNDTGLDAKLRAEKIKTIISLGLATDYCDKFTNEGGLKRGYNMHFLLNLARGITPEGSISALQDLQKFAQDKKQIFTVNYLTDANDGMKEEDVQAFEKAGVTVHRSTVDAFLQKFAPRAAAQSVQSVTPTRKTTVFAPVIIKK